MDVDFQDLFLSFEGRINRAKYWLGVVIVMAVDVVALLLFRNSVLYWLVAIAMIYPGLAVVVKRWHDRNKSGWWVLITLIPIVGAIWALIEVGFLPGTTGPNQYGEDPLTAIA